MLPSVAMLAAKLRKWVRRRVRCRDAEAVIGVRVEDRPKGLLNEFIGRRSENLLLRSCRGARLIAEPQRGFKVTAFGTRVARTWVGSPCPGAKEAR